MAGFTVAIFLSLVVSSLARRGPSNFNVHSGITDVTKLNSCFVARGEDELIGDELFGQLDFGHFCTPCISVLI